MLTPGRRLQAAESSSGVENGRHCTGGKNKSGDVGKPTGQDRFGGDGSKQAHTGSGKMGEMRGGEEGRGEERQDNARP